MMLRTIRIAATVLALTACVLVVLVWKRSHSLQEAVYGTVSPARALVIASERGELRSYTIPTTRLLRHSLYGTVSRCHECCHDGAECPVLCHDPARRMELAMPHWVAMLFPATIAAAPWLRMRFGLRTLLIGITMAAVLLGIMAASN
jgi:hypothetical protein